MFESEPQTFLVLPAVARIFFKGELFLILLHHPSSGKNVSSKLLSLQRNCIYTKPGMEHLVWISLRIKNGFDNQDSLRFFIFNWVGPAELCE